MYARGHINAVTGEFVPFEEKAKRIGRNIFEMPHRVTLEPTRRPRRKKSADVLEFRHAD